MLAEPRTHDEDVATGVPAAAAAAWVTAKPPKHPRPLPLRPLLPGPHLRSEGLLELENFLDVLRLLFPGGAALAVLPGHGRPGRRGRARGAGAGAGALRRGRRGGEGAARGRVSGRWALAAWGCSAREPEETGCGGRASSSAVSSFTLAAAVPPWLVFLLESGTDFLLPPLARLLRRGLPASLSATFLPPFSASRPPSGSLLLLLLLRRTPRPPRAPRPPPRPPPPRPQRCRLRGCPAPRAPRHRRQRPAPLAAAACALGPERGLLWGREQVRRTGTRGPGPGSTLFCKVGSRGREGFPPPRRMGAPLRRAGLRRSEAGRRREAAGILGALSLRVASTGRGGREPLRLRAARALRAGAGCYGDQGVGPGASRGGCGLGSVAAARAGAPRACESLPTHPLTGANSHCSKIGAGALLWPGKRTAWRPDSLGASGPGTRRTCQALPGFPWGAKRPGLFGCRTGVDSGLAWRGLLAPLGLPQPGRAGAASESGPAFAPPWPLLISPSLLRPLFGLANPET